ncbi:AlpA family transcriptional regulator [Mesorhizobium sp. INR15]|uniref:helix-turn-helix transcriptional regulator n=1 Tax=Mesorhizobium sp. INR15 TaxID=2654248 RepID=UPI00189696DB|nr:AlpA family phage regulatory protein [Mesorhizobium sp. INR15]QPC94745.1 AlpA family phage regulatory protein [Mesorhizobium sp. INR15]
MTSCTPDTERPKKTKPDPAALFVTDYQVGARYGASRATVWRWLKSDPSFPRPVSLSSGCSRWRIADLEAWEHQKSAA